MNLLHLELLTKETCHDGWQNLDRIVSGLSVTPASYTPLVEDREYSTTFITLLSTLGHTSWSFSSFQGVSSHITNIPFSSFWPHIVISSSFVVATVFFLNRGFLCSLCWICNLQSSHFNLLIVGVCHHATPTCLVQRRQLLFISLGLGV